ncbi:TRAP transporter substrate-binding protein DctP [Roseobacter sp. HKCCD9010]|jgi:TRAP-type C4-dicarboxylate transport system substrate-binding protein|uniref:TRAP transporter substrate-binding protein n=1 Tax=Rhodobacterales TaxID=204455 RepID=UPI00119BFB74|nr:MULTISPECIES: TRAP transporter substrate-binding protein [Rhodobacterales]MBF9052010.1 TRAP transporter substrate-binding protein DctP [Rhodobacterales bacterium HKCCD4356]NNV10355.1 TRAP transporter substrate-binding protein DctP [Roseobacter sp. HKCCD7357]NNV18175.1 TRAP transporter substrate-binding protein DctP [Roseobacter sp. HKCCD8768]NNV27635.1 TRAP transporter substrate-binding protein DctP [Roseobacter sp. HKCCD8192]NNV31901.1 TRAP transporter substrate-binding protein DctP [Roseo
MKAAKVLQQISRRDLLKLTSTYGMSSVVMGAATFTGAITLPSLARAVESTYERRYSREPEHQLTLGASGFNARNLLIERAGVLEFARDLEERTDGAIRIEFIGDNQICGQLNCLEKTQLGVVDMYAASTQNSAGAAPYLNVLDYAYMFRSRADQYHFLYSPDSMRLLRDPLEQRHGVKFLFSHAELRGIQLGQSFADRPTVTSLEELFGTRNRVTGTQLGRIAMQLLNLNPTPIAWEETLDGLRQGLIDGAETWASAVAYANMSPVVSQSVDLKFFCGTEHTGMSAEKFDAMSGELQDAIMESAYLAQVHVQAANEAALVNTVGFSDPVLPGTIFAENDVRPAFLPDDQIRMAEEMCSPEFNPEPWAQWRERLNGWAGGIDTYQEIYDIARQIPADTRAENVEPRRWWRTA